ncbi:MAG: hypothetical protein FJZ63_05275, partial [Chlamydiae bacterium]|nr:hypothetical protein [Chlamydiota bacterium]
MVGDFHLHFRLRARAFDFDFQKEAQASAKTVSINGQNYSLQGTAAAIDWLKDQIPDLSSSGDISLENLHSRLQ